MNNIHILSKDDFKKYKKKLKDAYHPVQIGSIGEYVTILKFAKRDISVAKMKVDIYDIDLLAYFGRRWNTIQVKTSTNGTDNTIVFPLTKNGWNLNNHTISSIKKEYSTNTVDYFVLYDALHDELFMVKNDGTHKSITIRYNRQIHGNKYNAKYAEDYQIDNVLDNIEYGYDSDQIVMIKGIDY